METRHDTVLLRESVESLGIVPGEVVVDGTVGAAGHFGLLYDALGGEGTLIGIDADQASLARAREVLRGKDAGPTVHLVEDNFRNLDAILTNLGIETVDKMLLDLGWNGFQLAAGRGFSFRVNEPLLMTYGTPEEGKTAADMVNGLPEEALADLIYTYGEERFARGIARAIVAARRRERILTTDQLVAAIMEGTPSWYQHRRLHPATKTFQALRIAVNDELGALREVLTTSFSRLSVCGRIAVITFHSIEDRIVKTAFRDAAYEGLGTVLTRKPAVPSARECAENPRARSAKLRVFEAGECVPSALETNESLYAV